MGCKIHSIEYYLPENVLTNEDIGRMHPEWSAGKIEKKLGIRKRHIVAENETALDLALKAGEKILKDYDRSKIDFVMLCTQSPDYFLPTSACILQDKLGLKKTCGAFDFNLGCSGYVYGLAIVKGLIAAGIARSVLLIMSETYSRHMHPGDISNRSIFGDAASATIIEYSDKEHILEFDLGTDGSGMNNLIVPNGCFRNPCTPNAPIITDDSGNIRTDNNLYMNGPEIFNFTIDSVPVVIENVLRKNKTEKSLIDHFILHQANKYMLGYLMKKMDLPEDKFYNNLLDTGNTVSSTIPIALKNLHDENKIKSGDKLLLCGFGVGYSWGGAVIIW
ncbi:MAG: 3-oxoacyl-ACP synthase [Bacteroidetes bacterium GWF2_38_335]|nr:MAG: 3-oxoacyl-ACP synthase [Bacteroidetes bacterium GWF2_38_335]OFY80306.1 MAG: 3-oxoacyl-ACP synthase [Bacteroidetes bacterium RIFOXYA12_FULL_38_20]HBS88894.1 3-oxoacyl-ACP synthase [Bacteroidales bacterium]